MGHLTQIKKKELKELMLSSLAIIIKATLKDSSFRLIRPPRL